LHLDFQVQTQRFSQLLNNTRSTVLILNPHVEFDDPVQIESLGALTQCTKLSIMTSLRVYLAGNNAVTETEDDDTTINKFPLDVIF